MTRDWPAVLPTGETASLRLGGFLYVQFSQSPRETETLPDMMETIKKKSPRNTDVVYPVLTAGFGAAPPTQAQTTGPGRRL